MTDTGVLDLPAPLLAATDAALAALAPPLLRLAIWGVAGALVSMGLYWLLSPQARIARGKAAVEASRESLDAYDGDLAGAWPMMRRMLGLSLRHVGIVAGPALLASVPLLCLIAWLATAYGYAYPTPGERTAARATPPAMVARLERPGTAPPHVTIADARGHVVADVALGAPVPILHTRRWWNVLLANPAGYLPSDAGLARVELDLPRREYIPVGPPWLRWWPFPFLVVLVATSLLVKRAGRIE